MISYKKYWEVQDRDWHKFGFLRAKNLAEEIVVGWSDQTDLSGFDLELTCHAMEFYGQTIWDGRAESHHDDVTKGLLALYCGDITCRGSEIVDGEGLHDCLMLGWAETMLAARALKSFSAWLQERLDAMPPEPALAA